MKRNWMLPTGLILALAVALFPVPGLAQVQLTYSPVESPVLNADVAAARPVAVGPVATGGPTVNLQVGTAAFSGPMDFYLALFVPTLVPTLFMIDPAGGIRPISAGLVAWRSGVPSVNESLFGDLPAANLPVATWQVLLAVAPTGTFAPTAVYRTSFGIGPAGDADADGIPDTVDGFPNDGLFFTPVTDLLVPLNIPAGATFSAAVALMNNNAGGFTRVVGNRDDAAGNVKATSWDIDVTNRFAAAPVTLNSIAGNNFSSAYGLNDAGVVVGESGKNGDTQFVAAIWPALPSPAVGELPGLNPAGNSAAYSINNAGFIVGEAEDASLVTRAVIWQADQFGSIVGGPGELTTGGFASTASSAYFINESGFIVGEVSDASGRNFAFLWKVDPGTGQLTSTVLLGDGAQEQSSIAMGVSSDGTRVVGEYTDLTTGDAHAVEWTLNFTTGTISRGDLGPAGSLAAINQNATPRFVGNMVDFSGNTAATIWDVRTTNPTLGQPLLGNNPNSLAFDINNQGVVAGTRNVGGVDSAFVVIASPGL